jgi:hypothetical protein
MSPAEPPVSVAVLRREADLAVADASLRAVAKEVGVSAMGLRAFIRGEHAPQDRTLRKLHAWHAARAARRPDRGIDEARSMLILLSGFYPPPDRSRVMRHFLRDMEREFRASRMAPPPWLATLRDELHGGEDADRG